MYRIVVNNIYYIKNKIYSIGKCKKNVLKVLLP